jgi:tetratricopeptide (TPR) repeat protein
VRYAAIALGLLAGPAPGLARAEEWQVVRSGHDPRLVAAARRVLEESPDDAAALRQLLSLQPAPVLVERYRARLASARPRYADAEILGHLLRRAASADEALVAYRRAAELDDARPEPHRLSAEIHRADGRFAEAADALGEALIREQVSGERRRLAAALVEMARKSGATDRALGPLARVFKSDPRAVGADLGRLLIEAGRNDEAAGVLRRLLDLGELRGEQRATVARLLGRACSSDARAQDAFMQALAALPRDHWMRREILSEMITAARMHDDLAGLAERLERAGGGFAEREALAGVLDELGEVDRAERALREAMRLRPLDVGLRRRLIAMLDRLGRGGDALVENRRLVALAPDDPSPLLALAERLWGRGEASGALAIAGSAGRSFASSETVHVQLAALYARWGRADLAARESLALARLAPGEPSYLIALGEQYFQHGDARRAHEVWRRLLRTVHPRERALGALADVLGEHEEFAEAIDLYERAVQLAPTDVDLLLRLARLLERARRPDQAAAALERALALPAQPKDRGARAETRARLVSLWERSRRLYVELPRLRRRFDSPSPDPDAGPLLTEAYARAGQLGAAEQVVRRMLERQPDNVDALAALARICRSTRRWPEAIAALGRLADLRPAERRERYWEMADLATDAGNDGDARTYAARALQAAPDADGHRRMAGLLEKAGDLDSAEVELRRSLALDPTAGETTSALARLYLQLGREQDALAVLRGLLRACGGDALLQAAPRVVDLAERLDALDDVWRDLARRAAEGQPGMRHVLLDLAARRADRIAGRTDGATVGHELERVGRAALRPLLEAIADPNPGAQRDALAALRRLPVPGLVDPLLSIASRRTPGEGPGAVAIRVEALAIAARQAGAEHVHTLSMLLADREGAVREAAALALATIGGARAAVALEPALADERPGVQALACLGIARGSPTAVPSIAHMFGDARRHPGTRSACALAQGASASPSAADVAALVALASQGGEPATGAAAALGMLAAPGAVAPLTLVWLGAPDPQSRVARWALGQIARGTRTALVWPRGAEVREGQLLWDEFVRGAIAATSATDVAGGGGPAPLAFPPDVVHAAAEAVGEAFSGPRDSALRAVSRLGAALAGAGHDDQPSLGLLADAARPALARLCGHHDPRLRAAAVDLLGEIGQNAAVEPLAAALGDADARVRAAAASALGRLVRRCPEARAAGLGALRAGQGAADWPTRLAVLRVFADAGALSAMSDDPSAFVRVAAVDALAAYPDPAAEASLRRALRDPVGEVRAAARRSLSALGRP